MKLNDEIAIFGASGPGGEYIVVACQQEWNEGHVDTVHYNRSVAGKIALSILALVFDFDDEGSLEDLKPTLLKYFPEPEMRDDH